VVNGHRLPWKLVPMVSSLESEIEYKQVLIFLADSTSSHGSRLARQRRADLSSTRASVSSTATATPTLGKATLSPSSSPKTPLIDKRRSLGGLPVKRRPMLIRNLNKVGTAKGM
jgi:hypothetical protein